MRRRERTRRWNLYDWQYTIITTSDDCKCYRSYNIENVGFVDYEYINNNRWSDDYWI